MHYPGLQGLARVWCRKVMLMGEERRRETDFLLKKKEIARREDGWMERSRGKMGEAPFRRVAVSDSPRQILSGPERKKLAGNGIEIE